MDRYEWTRRERPIRVALSTTVTRPPGRTGCWTVEAGQHWRADGSTEKAGADRLAGLLGNFLVQYEPPKVLTFRGYTAVLSLSLGDSDNAVTWSEQIIDPQGNMSTSSPAGKSWDEVLQSARHHLAHRSTDWHDDTSVQYGAAFLDAGQPRGQRRYGPEDFYEYASWQRAAKAAIEAGRADYHSWAGRHEHDPEFAVPRRSVNDLAEAAGRRAYEEDQPAAAGADPLIRELVQMIPVGGRGAEIFQAFMRGRAAAADAAAAAVLAE